MNVLGTADLQIFELEHPDLMAIWRAEADQRMKGLDCRPHGMLAQMASPLHGLFGGLWPR